MIIELTLSKDSKGFVKEKKADYQPSKEVRDRTAQVMADFTIGHEIQNKPYAEFNDISVIQRQDVSQRSFNAFVPEKSNDPDEAWKCISEDTEILTMDGWKRNGEISVGDKVLSYDIETSQILPDEAKSVFEYEFDGSMIRINNKHTDQLITPNHRTLVKKWERTTTDGKRVRNWWNEYRYVEAQDLDYSIYDFPLSGIYDGDISIGEDWAELVGWFLTDGCITKKDCYLTQSKPDTLLKLRELLDRMGVVYREWSRPKKDKNGNFGIYYDEYRFYFLKESEVSLKMRELIPNRKPTNNLLHLPLKEKQRLLLGLCLGDGSWDKEYNHYASVCKPYEDFKEWLQTLLHLMGMVGTISPTAVALRYSPSVQVESEDRNEIDYCGKVWSIETNRTNYIAKRNGHIFITGNSNAIRPIVRNRIISIAAHTTGALIYPQVFAQNDQDQEDKDAASVMRDLIEWASEQANYEQTFLYAVIASLVNPAAIIHTEYAENYRTVKEILDSGKWKETKILDEEFSGFKDTVVPLDELLIGDVYESNIQRQPFLIWRRAIDYSAACAKYYDNENFTKYVRPGLQVVFDSATDTFYEQYDKDLQERLVEEVIYWNRKADLRLVFVNGILLTDVDQPNPRKDKKYPFVKFGYELFDEGKFFYYRSLAQKLAQDESVVNILYRMIIDGAMLKNMPPSVLIGTEDVDSSVVTPGSFTRFEDPNTKFQPINLGIDLNAGIAGITKVESSISESSQDILQSGQAVQGSQTAFEISRLEQNARIMLGLFAKMIGFGVKALGELKMGDVLQFLTVGDIDEISGDGAGMKYKSFLLPDKNVNGATKTRRISFDASMPMHSTEEENMQMSYDLLNQEGGIDSEKEIIKANPTLFRKLKFKVKVVPNAITPPSDALKKALNLEEFDRLIQLPFINQEQVTKDLLLGSYDATRNDVEKYIVDKNQQAMMQQSQQQGVPPQSGENPLAKLLGTGGNQNMNAAANQGKVNQTQ